MSVQPIPEGYHSITPYLIIAGASRALEFYAQAFGAREVMRMPGPGDTVAHAEICVGNSMIMLADPYPDMGHRDPRAYGGTPVSLLLYVEDVDAVFQRAVAAGATIQRPLQNQFYGDRSGTVVDPFGHVWTISTHIEDVAPEEMERRMAALGH